MNFFVASQTSSFVFLSVKDFKHISIAWLSDEAFKIFLDVDPQIGAERVFKNQRPDEQPAKSANELKERMIARAKHDDLRYKKYYDISFRDKTKFDLIIDTSRLTPEEIFDRIMVSLKRFNIH